MPSHNPKTRLQSHGSQPRTPTQISQVKAPRRKVQSESYQAKAMKRKLSNESSHAKYTKCEGCSTEVIKRRFVPSPLSLPARVPCVVSYSSSWCDCTRSQTKSGSRTRLVKITELISLELFGGERASRGPERTCSKSLTSFPEAFQGGAGNSWA